MKRVSDNINLMQLLEQNQLGFMRTWYAISSEDSNEALAIVNGFKSYPSIRTMELNEEQVLFTICSSVCIIKGMIDIVLIKSNN